MASVSEVSGSTEAESPPSTEYSSPEDLATMKNELSTLFEQMFTKANIEVDEYIQANISPALTIPMELVLTAPRVRKICGDVNVVRDVLSECKIVSIEDDRVKLHVKLEQNTIILRNIPQNTDDQKIKDIFESAENCPVLTGVRSDIGDTWFVTFETEDDAKAALLAIGSSKFEGQPIKGRLKTESIAKAFLSSPSYRSPGGGAMNPEFFGSAGHIGMPRMPLPNAFPMYPRGPNGFAPVRPGPGGELDGKQMFVHPMMHSGIPLGAPGMNWPQQGGGGRGNKGNKGKSPRGHGGPHSGGASTMPGMGNPMGGGWPMQFQGGFPMGMQMMPDGSFVAPRPFAMGARPQGPGQGGYARYGSNSPGASPRGGDADRNFRDDRRKDGGNRQGGENGSAGDGEHKGNMRSAGDSTLESTDGDKRKKRNGRKKGDKDSDGNGKRSSGRGDGGGNSDRRDGGANTGRQSKKKSPSFNALDFPSLADGDAGAAAVVGTTGSSSAATTPLAGAWASARLGGSREKESGASFSTAEDKGKEDEQAAAPSSRTQEGPTEGPNVRADASSNGEALVPSSTQPVNGGNVSAPQSLRGTQIASAAAGDGSQKAAAAETVAPKPTEKEVSTAGESASATVDQPADHEHVGPWGGKISFSDVVKKGK